MGAVAATYFIATAFAAAIACCGRDPISKLASAYLLSSWMISNQVFQAQAPEGALEIFSYFDLCTVIILTLVWLHRPRVWLGLMITALYLQVGGQTYFRLSDEPVGLNAYRVNNGLFIVQLVAVTIPTLVRLRPRRRRKPFRRIRPRINPPYEGWEPPPDYRLREAND